MFQLWINLSPCPEILRDAIVSGAPLRNPYSYEEIIKLIALNILNDVNIYQLHTDIIKRILRLEIDIQRFFAPILVKYPLSVFTWITTSMSRLLHVSLWLDIQDTIDMLTSTSLRIENENIRKSISIFTSYLLEVIQPYVEVIQMGIKRALSLIKLEYDDEYKCLRLDMPILPNFSPTDEGWHEVYLNVNIGNMSLSFIWYLLLRRHEENQYTISTKKARVDYVIRFPDSEYFRSFMTNLFSNELFFTDINQVELRLSNDKMNSIVENFKNLFVKGKSVGEAIAETLKEWNGETVDGELNPNISMLNIACGLMPEVTTEYLKLFESCLILMKSALE